MDIYFWIRESIILGVCICVTGCPISSKFVRLLLLGLKRSLWIIHLMWITYILPSDCNDLQLWHSEIGQAYGHQIKIEFSFFVVSHSNFAMKPLGLHLFWLPQMYTEYRKTTFRFVSKGLVNLWLPRLYS